MIQIYQKLYVKKIKIRFLSHFDIVMGKFYKNLKKIICQHYLCTPLGGLKVASNSEIIFYLLSFLNLIKTKFFGLHLCIWVSFRSFNNGYVEDLRINTVISSFYTENT